MEQLNKVELRGIVGTIRTNDVCGKKSASFTLATNYVFKDKDGCCVIETTWHNIIAFESAQIQHLESINKGDRVQVIGRLRNRRYIDAMGKERDSIDVIAQQVLAIQ